MFCKQTCNNIDFQKLTVSLQIYSALLKSLIGESKRVLRDFSKKIELSHGLMRSDRFQHVGFNPNMWVSIFLSHFEGLDYRFTRISKGALASPLHYQCLNFYIKPFLHQL